MGRPKSYTCKVCRNNQGSPFGLQEHYKNNPTHMPAYLVKRHSGEQKGKVRKIVTSAIDSNSPFQKIVSLKEEFTAAVQQKQFQVEELKSQLTVAEEELSKFLVASKALSEIETPEISQPHVVKNESEKKSKGGYTYWSRFTPEQRSKEMSRRRAVTRKKLEVQLANKNYPMGGVA